MGMLIDELGHRYGRWTVIRREQIPGKRSACWLCRCECGVERIIDGRLLRSGLSKSCGCARVKDESGKRYGKLTVIQRYGSRPAQGTSAYAQWLCRCDCGEERIVVGSALRQGTVLSCGCTGNKLAEGKAAFRNVYRSYKRSAKVRHIDWSLSEEEVTFLTQQTCTYCGQAPTQIRRVPNTNGEYVYNGIDRVDNNKGYIRDNVVPCCKWCNVAKGTRLQEEFLDWIIQAYEYLVEAEV